MELPINIFCLERSQTPIPPYWIAICSLQPYIFSATKTPQNADVHRPPSWKSGLQLLPSWYACSNPQVILLIRFLKAFFYMPNGMGTEKCRKWSNKIHPKINKNSPTFFLQNHLVPSRLSTGEIGVFFVALDHGAREVKMTGGFMWVS